MWRRDVGERAPGGGGGFLVQDNDAAFGRFVLINQTLGMRFHQSFAAPGCVRLPLRVSPDPPAPAGARSAAPTRPCSGRTAHAWRVSAGAQPIQTGRPTVVAVRRHMRTARLPCEGPQGRPGRAAPSVTARGVGCAGLRPPSALSLFRPSHPPGRRAGPPNTSRCEAPIVPACACLLSRLPSCSSVTRLVVRPPVVLQCKKYTAPSVNCAALAPALGLLPLSSRTLIGASAGPAATVPRHEVWTLAALRQPPIRHWVTLTWPPGRATRSVTARGLFRHLSVCGHCTSRQLWRAAAVILQCGSTFWF